MSRCFVPDEWLLHDLGGENGPERQSDALEFLQALKAICDRLVVGIHDDRWMRKAYGLMRHPDVVVQICSKYLHNSIILDSNKFLTVDGEVADVPIGLAACAPAGDYYLFQTFYAHEETTVLITSDVKLIAAFTGQEFPRLVFRQRTEFIQEYIAHFKRPN